MVRNGVAEQCYLAVDIGASSGRHILGYLEDGVMKIEEIYRFSNGMKKENGEFLWDLEHLFAEIVNGMKMCKTIGKIPKSMSIDTWAVDYVLLDKQDQILGKTYGYRDKRTEGMDREVYQIIPEEALFARTGIQKQPFNTIYQLMAVKKQTPELLEQAETFLMLPDYFQFLLTGNKVSEYTNATSTQLVDPKKKQWDCELIEMLRFGSEKFLPLQMPGTEVGRLTAEIQKQIGFDCSVVLCASHDTASAVMAVPCTDKDSLYISSGTWSLMGVELEQALCDERSRQGNFTNEGGYDYRFRYLKNIMGLWIIQSVRHEYGDKYSFAELCELAESCSEFPSLIDVNDTVFLAPDSMITAIQDYCKGTGQLVPEQVGEIAGVVYRSLAASYGDTVKEIERNTKRFFDSIHIIGGGSKADYLNELTAKATGKTIFAGPGEATAIGNLMAQMIKAGALKDLSQARDCVFRSFDIRKFEG